MKQMENVWISVLNLGKSSNIKRMYQILEGKLSNNKM